MINSISISKTSPITKIEKNTNYDALKQKIEGLSNLKKDKIIALCAFILSMRSYIETIDGITHKNVENQMLIYLKKIDKSFNDGDIKVLFSVCDSCNEQKEEGLFGIVEIPSSLTTLLDNSNDNTIKNYIDLLQYPLKEMTDGDVFNDFEGVEDSVNQLDDMINSGSYKLKVVDKMDHDAKVAYIERIKQKESEPVKKEPSEYFTDTKNSINREKDIANYVEEKTADDICSIDGLYKRYFESYEEPKDIVAEIRGRLKYVQGLAALHKILFSRSIISADATPHLFHLLSDCEMWEFYIKEANKQADLL